MTWKYICFVEENVCGNNEEWNLNYIDHTIHDTRAKATKYGKEFVKRMKKEDPDNNPEFWIIKSEYIP